MAGVSNPIAGGSGLASVEKVSDLAGYALGGGMSETDGHDDGALSSA